jgi:hypothetical protein
VHAREVRDVVPLHADVEGEDPGDEPRERAARRGEDPEPGERDPERDAGVRS